MVAPDPAPDPLGPGSPLLGFFKALSDASRLAIVGRLALRPHAVEELAEALDLRPSTVSHHLARLAEVGLVRAHPESWFTVYRLDTAALERIARAVLAAAQEPPAPADDGLSAFDRKVLRTFLTAEGTLRALPAQRKKRLAILRHLVAPFEPGRRYTEKQVNEVLRRFSREHFVTLRRYLVDEGFMEREGGGGEYWRAGGDRS